MRIALHGRNFKPKAKPYIEALFQLLEEENVMIYFSESFYKFLKSIDFKTPPHENYQNPICFPEVDVLLSIGGDGTLLECVTQVGDKQTPILGINTGRLGFLAITSPEDLNEAIQNILRGYYQIDQRTLISLEADKNIFEGLNYALNDFTITKRDTSSMIVVHTYIDGEYLNSYWADGLIVSTPTGSTGYSLSCGGPVVLPETNNFIIAPVSPHNLNVRPMVVSDDSVISFEIEGRSKNFLVSLDSRSRVIDASVQLAVKKEKFKAHLVRFQEENFLNTLRNKLSWGLDVRN